MVAKGLWWDTHWVQGGGGLGLWWDTHWVGVRIMVGHTLGPGGGLWWDTHWVQGDGGVRVMVQVF